MAKTLTRHSLLTALAAQELGYSFGKPIRTDEKSLAVVLPILRESSLKRQYITFPETDQVLVFDTGAIDRMEAQNNTSENVFIRSGTIFRGKTQERALQRSAVVFPGKKMDLSVRCVHASRGIISGSHVTYGGLTPHDVDKKSYSAGYKSKDQGQWWANVSSSNAAMRCHMTGGGTSASAFVPTTDNPTPTGHPWPDDFNVMMNGLAAGSTWSEPQSYAVNPLPLKQDDLASHLDAFAKNFEAVLSKVKRVEHQAGLALITDKGVETIEVFDHEDSWKALHESAVKRLGSNLCKQNADDVFTYNPDKAVSAVSRVLGLDFAESRIYEHRPTNGEPSVEITGLTAGDYVGEVVELDGKVIHLVLLKKED